MGEQGDETSQVISNGSIDVEFVGNAWDTQFTRVGGSSPIGLAVMRKFYAVADSGHIYSKGATFLWGRFFGWFLRYESWRVFFASNINLCTREMKYAYTDQSIQCYNNRK